MATIVWTREAVQNLKDLFAYISKDNPEAAKKVITGIYDKTQLLVEYPQIGWKYEAVENREVRILLYGHYRIAYQICRNQRINILGVFHAAMNIGDYL